VDESSTQSSSGARVVLINPDKDEVSIAIKLDFLPTKNEAEYETVLARLGIAQELGARNLEIYNDSQVVAGHIQGGFYAKVDKMIKYLAKVQSF
jgi:ribonuclease HI